VIVGLGGFAVAKMLEKSNVSNLIKNARKQLIYFKRCKLRS
jgi:hypothetical protein